jgi:hypothetical protein
MHTHTHKPITQRKEMSKRARQSSNPESSSSDSEECYVLLTLPEDYSEDHQHYYLEGIDTSSPLLRAGSDGKVYTGELGQLIGTGMLFEQVREIDMEEKEKVFGKINEEEKKEEERIKCRFAGKVVKTINFAAEVVQGRKEGRYLMSCIDIHFLKFWGFGLDGKEKELLRERKLRISMGDFGRGQNLKEKVKRSSSISNKSLLNNLRPNQFVAERAPSKHFIHRAKEKDQAQFNA